MANTTWMYDEDTGRYIVKNARALFVNFEGAEQDYNMAGKRNFRLNIPQDLADDLKDRGVHVKLREARTDDEEDQYTVKIGVYRDADIRLLSGRNLTKMNIDNDNPDNDDGEMIDNEFRKGHVMNGTISLEFHVSRNTRVMTSAPYARVDTMIIPIRKSRLLSEFEDEYIGDAE